jgi:hypothetical protein
MCQVARDAESAKKKHKNNTSYPEGKKINKKGGNLKEF